GRRAAGRTLGRSADRLRGRSRRVASHGRRADRQLRGQAGALQDPAPGHLSGRIAAQSVGQGAQARAARVLRRGRGAAGVTGRRLRLGVDIGGTFTDFVLADADSGQLTFYKSLTTPEEPARGVMEGIAALLALAGAAPAEVQTVIHGTTLASNAIIERKG